LCLHDVDRRLAAAEAEGEADPDGNNSRQRTLKGEFAGSGKLLGALVATSSS
jgi:hypothetical protein